MSEILGKALLHLGVDKSALTKGLAAAKTETGEAVGGMGGLFKSLSVIAVASFVGIALSVKKVADAYGEQEAAEIRFQNALRKTGQFSEETKQEFLDFASVMQNLTALDDSLIVSLGGLLLNLGVLPADLQRATKAGADLSAALDIDLRAAMMLVGRAATGNIELFARYGVTFDKAKAEAGGFNFILSELERRFGGQAQANAEGYAKSLIAIANSFGDLLEQIGKPFAQAITQGKSPVVFVLDSMREGLAGIESISRRAGESFGRFVVGLLKLPPATEAVRKSFDAGLKGMEERTESLIDQQEELTEAVIKRYTEMADATIKISEEEAKEEAEIASKLIEDKAEGERKLAEAIIKMHVETAETVIRIAEEEAQEEARIAIALLEEKEKIEREFIASEVKRAEELVKLAEEEADEEAKILIKLAEDKEKADRSFVKGVKEGFDELEKRTKDYASISKSLILDAYEATQRSLSDGFFATLTGDFKALEELPKQFANSMIRSFSDMLAKIATNKLFQIGGQLVSNVFATPFAEGGIVTKPTVGLIGEAGPEVVIPLELIKKYLSDQAVGQAGGLLSVTGAVTAAALFFMLDAINHGSGTRAIGALALGRGGEQGLIPKGLGALGLGAFRGGRSDPHAAGLGNVETIRRLVEEVNLFGAEENLARVVQASGGNPFEARSIVAGANPEAYARMLQEMGLGDAAGRFITGPSIRVLGEMGAEHVLNVDSPASIRALTEGLRPIVSELSPGGEPGGMTVGTVNVTVNFHGADLGTPSGRREAARLLVREINAELLDLNRRTVGGLA